MDIGYRNTLEQKQLLSQTQIQSLNILSMDNVELNDFLQGEYMENPMLEYTGSKEGEMSQVEFSQWYESHGMEHDYEENDYHEDSDQRREIPVYDGDQLEDYLLSQLNQLDFTKKQLNMIRFMIACLDDNGYFKTPLIEVAKMNHGTVEEAEYCLSQLRELEPFGIFSKDLTDCLLWQLKEEGEEDEVLISMIENHLNDIAQGHLSNISREMKLSTSQVRQYIARISKLNPRPLVGFDLGKTEYIVPDIIFTYKDNEWEISLNDNWIGDYKLSNYYMKMMKEAKDEQLYQYFRKKLERVRFLMSSVEQRRITMLNISKAILEWQQDFFEGKGLLKPMTMADIAEKIEMHTSTISRGIKGKYLQCPNGTMLIKTLFSASVNPKNTLSKEGSVTAGQIKKVLKELIDGENKAKPYSDQKLVTLLCEKEIKISRRTVAKYREEMGIKGTFERKQNE